jgi:hypothetical protein
MFDYYFERSWRSPEFLEAGVMRVDRTVFFNGWNKGMAVE